MTHVLIAGDYSQIELRFLAMLSGSVALTSAYGHGVDVHVLTAMERYQVQEDQVTFIMRNLAKRANYGIPYGLSALGLYQQMQKQAMDDSLPDEVRASLRDTTMEECAEFIEAFHRTYDGVAEYMDTMRELVYKQGWVETMFGRVRHIPEIRSSDKHIREHAERSAINLPIQGSAADLLKLALTAVAWSFRALKLWQVRLALTVHDSIEARARQEVQREAAWVLSYAMEHAVNLPLATPVDIKVGPNMLALKEVEHGSAGPDRFTESEGIRTLSELLPLWRDEYRKRGVHGN